MKQQQRRRVSREPASGTPRFSRLSGKMLVAVQQRVGEMAVKFPLIAKHLGHSSPKRTLVDYLHEENLDRVGREAAAFLIDFLTLKTSDLIKKWYGDDVEPTALLRDGPNGSDERLGPGHVVFPGKQ